MLDDYKAVRLALSDARIASHSKQLIAISARNLNLDSQFVSDLTDLLEQVTHSDISNATISSEISNLISLWGKHLSYRYEEYIRNKRSELFFKYYWPLCVGKPVKRLLDFGCGRGFLVPDYIKRKCAEYVLGIDEVEYTSDWQHIRSEYGSSIEFDRIDDWMLPDLLKQHDPYDVIVLSYVLHHMSNFEAEILLSNIASTIGPDTKIVIIEDSIAKTPAQNIPQSECVKIWNTLWAGDNQYLTSTGFGVQVVLDWYANVFLAEHIGIKITGNYKTLEDWHAILSKSGFKSVNSFFLGWPIDRDIDVPQSILVAET